MKSSCVVRISLVVDVHAASKLLLRGNFDALSIEEVRGLCSAIGLVPRYRDESGAWKYIAVADLRKVLRIEAAKEEGDRMWAYKPSDVRKVPSLRVHMYWSAPAFSLWSDETTLPSYAQVGLSSAVGLGYSVWLWSHHKFVKGVPTGVKLLDASALWFATRGTNNYTSSALATNQIALGLEGRSRIGNQTAGFRIPVGSSRLDPV